MGRKNIEKPEVLAPAGTLKTKTAILYGQMQFSLVGEAYGLRSLQGTSTLQK